MRKNIGGTVLLLFLLLFSYPTLTSLKGIPTSVRMFSGTEYSLHVGRLIRVFDGNGKDVTGAQRIFTVEKDVVGEHAYQVSLFGLFPVRSLTVHVLPAIYVIPGGHSIGVLLSSHGVVIRQLVSVMGVDGKEYFPAREAGLLPGDRILTLSGKEILRPEEVAGVLQELARESSLLELKVQREEELLTLFIRPALTLREDYLGRLERVYMLGVYLEDPAAGVGTLSFYDPLTRRYGALGHTIADSRGRRLYLREGTIVHAFIDSVKQGLRGLPGEKLGTFQSERDILGSVDKNSTFGIYGTLRKDLTHPFFREPIPVALQHQVHTGKAHIYTVVAGHVVEEFEVEIQKVTKQSAPEEKGLVIRVTDPFLLQRTGGIVQGMSGSPIVQNGMLVGAITHVFVNDPTRGYGNLMEWMIWESELVQELGRTLDTLGFAA